MAELNDNVALSSSPLDETGILEDLEHLLAWDFLGFTIEHGHFFLGEPRRLRQTSSDTWIAVELIGANEL